MSDSDIDLAALLDFAIQSVEEGLKTSDPEPTAFGQPSNASMVSNRRATILERRDSCGSINLGHLG
jgi:hypothetical protein